MAEDKRQEEKEFSFVKEKIKHQPVYQHRWFRKTLFQLALAVVCGVLACFVFVLVHPFMEQHFGRKETTEITLPEEEVTAEEKGNDGETQKDPIVISQVQELEIEDYEVLYRKMRAVASEGERSLVTVTVEKSDTDWFNETYESQNYLSGLLVGNNSVELLILSGYSGVEAAARLEVTFADNITVPAVLKNYDCVTDLAVLSVNLADVPQGTMDYIRMADFGSSAALSAGEPVIAVGSPAGVPGSLMFGSLSVPGYSVSVIDGEYTLLITDMPKSTKNSGVLLNLKGKVIGLLQDTYQSSTNRNVLTAYGISDIKNVIEHLSNNKDIVYFGIKGTMVPEDIMEAQGIPAGIYVTAVEMNSPAMNAGVQPGDVLTELNGKELRELSDLQDVLRKLSNEQLVKVAVMRQGREGYQEIPCSVTLERLK